MIADKDEHIKTILSVIPEKPGCYQYFDENGTMKTDWLTQDEPKTTGILLFQQGT